MFGDAFYNQTTRRLVAVFGSYFNNIRIQRKDDEGGVVQDFLVPISYGPAQKFLVRLKQDPDFKAPAMILPRMGFEITGFQYSPERKLPATQRLRGSIENVVLTFYEDDASGFSIGEAVHQKDTNAKGIVESRSRNEITLSRPSGVFGRSARMWTITVNGGNGAETGIRLEPVIVEDDDAEDGEDTSVNRLTLDPGGVAKLGIEDGSQITQMGGAAGTVARVQADDVIDLTLDSGGAAGFRKSGWSKQITGGKTGHVAAVRDVSVPGLVQTVYVPVSMDLNLNLSIMARYNDDGMKIVEQIIPYFKPSVTPSVRMLDDIDRYFDIPITLNSVSQDDSFESSFEDRRAMMWNLDFTMKAYYFSSTSERKIIKFANTNVYSSISADPAGNVVVSIGPATGGDFQVGGKVTQQASDDNGATTPANGTVSRLETIVEFVKLSTPEARVAAPVIGTGDEILIVRDGVETTLVPTPVRAWSDGIAFNLHDHDLAAGDEIGKVGETGTREIETVRKTITLFDVKGRFQTGTNIMQADPPASAPVEKVSTAIGTHAYTYPEIEGEDKEPVEIQASDEDVMIVTEIKDNLNG